MDRYQLPMTSIQFYHLTTTPLERALPKLLEKVVSAGYRVLLVVGSEAQAEHLNQLLWSYDPGSFLPHGMATGDKPQKQPILVSTTFDAFNKANVLMVTHGVIPPQSEVFERILDMFDGRDAEAVNLARNRWKNYKEFGLSLSYLRQTETGGWEQKTAA